ncbi:glycosyltransferase family 2 protein [Fibrivirga algicola]|uniref:Glycosyltransferase n=1 Tax=Fibrivirga algicola TaxID=2950420 RepID=A0ABX0QNF0_9BACT|nr:glycosyltransferase family 2 protein [Fibrivirga algicola]NID11654.1 glycosyltransferase [Fibrivirga algicola]
MNPLISIITVTYQAGKTLEKSIISVINQKLQFDYIIIDGGSNDETINIINKYCDKISYWVSEPDNGIYDAMNKGLSKASGEWIYFLGADDILEDDALLNIKPYLRYPYLMVCGDIIFDTGHHVRSFLNNRIWLQNTVHHQATFYKRILFHAFKYDVSYKAIADYELNLKIFVNGYSFLYVPLTLARCKSNGISSQMKISLVETNLIREKFLGKGYNQKLLSSLLRVYYFQKEIRSYLKDIFTFTVTII